MQDQNFKNHAKIVPGFHIVASLVVLTVLILGVILMVQLGFGLQTVMYLLIGIALLMLFAYTRIFAIQNQDKTIIAEENFRTFRLTGKLLNERLTKSQIIALRFASDNEFVALCQKAVDENLAAKDIKTSIQNWRADYNRV